jgi:hypothetical protein
MKPLSRPSLLPSIPEKQSGERRGKELFLPFVKRNFLENKIFTSRKRLTASISSRFFDTKREKITKELPDDWMVPERHCLSMMMMICGP